MTIEDLREETRKAIIADAVGVDASELAHRTADQLMVALDDQSMFKRLEGVRKAMKWAIDHRAHIETMTLLSRLYVDEQSFRA